MITGVRSIKNTTKAAVTVVRSDAPRLLGNADHLIVRPDGSEPVDWNVPWGDDKLAEMMAEDPTSN